MLPLYYLRRLLSGIFKEILRTIHILLNYFENNSVCDDVVNYVIARILQHLVG